MQADASAERARFRRAVDRLRLATGYSMEDVAAAFGVSLNLAQRWRAEGVTEGAPSTTSLRSAVPLPVPGRI